MTRKKTIAILDGFGMSEKTEGNAIAGNAPFFDFLTKQYPFCTLSASGADVGLPRGQMGNSEVGHLNIGAGRVVFQDLPRINNSINDGSFFENSELVSACEKAKSTGSRLHIMGLVSDGGVHSYMSHIYALLELAKRKGGVSPLLYGRQGHASRQRIGICPCFEAQNERNRHRENSYRVRTFLRNGQGQPLGKD